MNQSPIYNGFAWGRKVQNTLGLIPHLKGYACMHIRRVSNSKYRDSQVITQLRYIDSIIYLDINEWNMFWIFFW